MIGHIQVTFSDLKADHLQYIEILTISACFAV